MPHNRPHLALTTPLHLSLLGVVLLAWCWDTAVSAWNLLPVLAADRLSSDPRVLRIEDLPPGGLAALQDVLPSDTLAVRLADDLWADRYTPVLEPLQRLIVSAIVDARIDRDSQVVLLLNRVPVGHVGTAPVRGLDEAAIAWFGKRCSELDADEFRTLLSMIDLDEAVLPDWQPSVARG